MLVVYQVLQMDEIQSYHLNPTHYCTLVPPDRHMLVSTESAFFASATCNRMQATVLKGPRSLPPCGQIKLSEALVGAILDPGGDHS